MAITGKAIWYVRTQIRFADHFGIVTHAQNELDMEKWLVRYLHETNITMRHGRVTSTAKTTAKQTLARQTRDIFIDEWRETGGATHCVLEKVSELYCNRCDPAVAPEPNTDKPSKSITKTTPTQKRNHHPGSQGKGCPCRMHIKHFALFADKQKVGSKVIISDSLLAAHEPYHSVDIMFSYIENEFAKSHLCLR